MFCVCINNLNIEKLKSLLVYFCSKYFLELLLKNLTPKSISRESKRLRGCARRLRRLMIIEQGKIWKMVMEMKNQNLVLCIVSQIGDREMVLQIGMFY